MARDSLSSTKPKSTATKVNSFNVKRRTAKACDRCRLKKAKCDGAHNCKTCRAADGVCTYSARRGRDVRHYYSRMRDITDNALKMLYRACQESSSFPGIAPEEDDQGDVSTNAILHALGLIGSDVDEHGFPAALGNEAKQEDSATDVASTGSETPYPLSQDKATPSDMTVRTETDTLDQSEPSPITHEMAMFINNYSCFPDLHAGVGTNGLATHLPAPGYPTLKPWGWTNPYEPEQLFLGLDDPYCVC